jgi:2-dehydro-3-deoxygluconokinase
VSRLGADPAGRRIRAALDGEGVNLSWVTTDDYRPTGLMLRDTAGGLLYLRHGSAASVLDVEDLDGVPLEDARAVLVTGITAMLGPGPQRAAIAAFDRARGLRIVDPNLRVGLWGSERATELIMPLIGRCDILLGGAAELQAFADGEGESLARACAALGPREIVVKRGAAGASALDPDGGWHDHPPVQTTEQDPVGAGDAFNAAYVAMRLGGGDVAEALKAGAIAGSAAAATVGDTGGAR